MGAALPKVEVRAVLRELAAATGEPVQQVLEEAVECCRRERFFTDLDAPMLALRATKPTGTRSWRIGATRTAPWPTGSTGCEAAATPAG
jgi:hypothetical protein